MVETETPNVVKLIDDLRAESASYLKQWHLWLGVGSGGGAVALLSLAASLPDPDYAVHFMLPSLWAFFTGVASTATGLLVQALQRSAMGEHFASAHNRDSLATAIRKIPEMFSSPKRLADEHNVERNKLIEKNKLEHERAERAWRMSRVWRALWMVTHCVSCAAFLIGFGWPLVYISMGGKLTP